MTAEIGLVGRGKKSYDIYLGGEPVGIRLNDVFPPSDGHASRGTQPRRTPTQADP